MNDDTSYSSYSIASFILCFFFSVPAFILSFLAIKEGYNEKSVLLAKGVRIASIVKMITIFILLLIWLLITNIAISRQYAKATEVKSFEETFIEDDYVPMSDRVKDADINKIIEESELK